MHVIRHYLKHVDMHAGIPRIQALERGMHHAPGVAQYHLPASDVAKPAGSVVSNHRHEVRTSPGVVVPLEADRLATMDVRFRALALSHMVKDPCRTADGAHPHQPRIITSPHHRMSTLSHQHVSTSSHYQITRRPQSHRHTITSPDPAALPQLPSV
jgi:hypothetical protein